jgi:prevent-host-death family protein
MWELANSKPVTEMTLANSHARGTDGSRPRLLAVDWQNDRSPPWRLSATEAKNRFGYYLAQAQRQPVQVMKNERVAVVMISAARYAELEALEQKKSMAQRQREINETYAEWISAQNELVERVGVFGEEYRPW